MEGLVITSPPKAQVGPASHLQRAVAIPVTTPRPKEDFWLLLYHPTVVERKWMGRREPSLISFCDPQSDLIPLLVLVLMEEGRDRQDDGAGEHQPLDLKPDTSFGGLRL